MSPVKAALVAVGVGALLLSPAVALALTSRHGHHAPAPVRTVRPLPNHTTAPAAPKEVSA